MSYDLTPERRAELRRDAERRRLFRFVTGTASDGYPSSGYESIDEDLLALLDAADERDRLAAAIERVRALHVRDEFGFCVVCDYMTPHPCPSRRALGGADGGPTT